MQIQGLIRFFSHKAVEFEGSALPITTDDNKEEGSEKLKNMMRHWDRLSELWFECNDDWTKGLIENPPAFTKPEWATLDKFPFLEPGVDFVHTFILESPDCDFTKHFLPYIIKTYPQRRPPVKPAVFFWYTVSSCRKFIYFQYTYFRG